MHSSFRFILYSLVALMIAAAIGFFIFREPLLQAGSPSVDLTAWSSSLIVTAEVGPSAEILKTPALAGLTNYAPTFDFERICWRPDPVVSRNEEGSVSAPAGCRQGNSLPFLNKKE